MDIQNEKNNDIESNSNNCKICEKNTIYKKYKKCERCNEKICFECYKKIDLCPFCREKYKSIKNELNTYDNLEINEIPIKYRRRCNCFYSQDICISILKCYIVITFISMPLLFIILRIYCYKTKCNNFSFSKFNITNTSL